MKDSDFNRFTANENCTRINLSFDLRGEGAGVCISSDDFLTTEFRLTFRRLVPFNSDKLPTENGEEVTGSFP
jgi:hypothetical protein